MLLASASSFSIKVGTHHLTIRVSYFAHFLSSVFPYLLKSWIYKQAENDRVKI